MWNKTTYPFLVQALCIIPLKSIRMWASLSIFAVFIYMSSDETMSVSVDDMNDKIKIISG